MFSILKYRIFSIFFIYVKITLIHTKLLTNRDNSGIIAPKKRGINVKIGNIGIDIDGVLTDIESFQLKFGESFFKNKYNN